MNSILDLFTISNLDIRLEVDKFLKNDKKMVDLQTTSIYSYMQSDFMMAFVFIFCFYFSYKSVEAYFRYEILQQDERVENHTVHVIFPKFEDLRQDQGKPSNLNMTYA